MSETRIKYANIDYFLRWNTSLSNRITGAEFGKSTSNANVKRSTAFAYGPEISFWLGWHRIKPFTEGHFYSNYAGGLT